MTPKSTPIVSMSDVSVVFGGVVRALDRIDFKIATGSIVGLVGESGSGKTTLCRVLVGLTTATSGTVEIGGVALAKLLGDDTLAYRRRVQMLLQDAVASLSPRMTVRGALDEPIRIHNLPEAESWQRLGAILHRLGLTEDVLTKFPHQISGGQARRVGVARALVMQPALIVADEPTAGLDVSVQGELLNLLMDLRREFDLTYLLVSHNLNVVRRITDRVAVMYLGQIVEEAPTRALYAKPAHPYTAALLSTNPALDPAKRRKRIILKGEIPSVVAPPSGCRFHTRCPAAQAVCSAQEPPLKPLNEAHSVRCHFPYAVDLGA
jgi:oligopeptide transport system ATP-binding protein